jgi:hypothetical protein
MDKEMKEEIIKEVESIMEQLEEIKQYCNYGSINLNVLLIPILVSKHNLSNLSFIIENELRKKKV